MWRRSKNDLNLVVAMQIRCLLKQLIEKYKEKTKELHKAFMDLKKAYKNVCRQTLWKVLYEGRVDDYLVDGAKSLYKGNRVCAKWGNGAGECFQLMGELKLGYVNSPWLFYAFLDKKNRSIKERTTVRGMKLREGNGREW